MSITLPAVRTRVRVKLRESDSRRVSFGIVEVDQAIRDAYLLMQAQLPPAHLYTANAFTILAGAEDFTLPTTSSAEYAGDVRIQLVSDHRFLRHLTVEEIDSWRNRDTTQSQAKPEYFALWEEDDQEVQCRCYPRSKDSEVCNLYKSLVAADFDLTDVDATNIRFSRYAINALVLQTASDLAATLTDDDLKLRRLNPNVVNLWASNAATLLYEEECRRHDLEGVGRTQRWVS